MWKEEKKKHAHCMLKEREPNMPRGHENSISLNDNFPPRGKSSKKKKKKAVSSLFYFIYERKPPPGQTGTLIHEKRFLFKSSPSPPFLFFQKRQSSSGSFESALSCNFENLHCLRAMSPTYYFAVRGFFLSSSRFQVYRYGESQIFGGRAIQGCSP